jgi:hypothetical protein
MQMRQARLCKAGDASYTFQHVLDGNGLPSYVLAGLRIVIFASCQP